MKAATDALVTANATAVDSGTKALQQQKHQKEVVVKFLIQLAHWAEENCKDDMTTFLSSGFHAVSSSKSKTPPVSEMIRKIVQGNSGQLVVTLVKYPGAASYELRWGQAPAGGGMPAAWNSQPLANVRTPATISGLTPGTTYIIQARAVTKAGYSDYGQPLSQMVSYFSSQK